MPHVFCVRCEMPTLRTSLVLEAHALQDDATMQEAAKLITDSQPKRVTR
jgi:hypothetical protein